MFGHRIAFKRVKSLFLRTDAHPKRGTGNPPALDQAQQRLHSFLFKHGKAIIQEQGAVDSKGVTCKQYKVQPMQTSPVFPKAREILHGTCGKKQIITNIGDGRTPPRLAEPITTQVRQCQQRLGFGGLLAEKYGSTRVLFLTTPSST